MEAKEYVDRLRDDNDIIDLHHFREDSEIPDGMGKAVILDHEHHIAAMLSDCGSPETTGIKAGAIVRFSSHPEVKTQRIIGTPAYAVPTVIAGTRQ